MVEKENEGRCFQQMIKIDNPQEAHFKGVYDIKGNGSRTKHCISVSGSKAK